jgi:hypothetical protein
VSVPRLRRLPAPVGWSRFAVDRAGVMLGVVEKRGNASEGWVGRAEDGTVMPRTRTREDAIDALLIFADRLGT